MHTTSIITKTKWKIDPIHSEIGFKAKYMMFTYVRGHFKEFDASIHTCGDDFLSATIDCWLNPASIDTGNEERDNHLRSADFFDSMNFKVITFAADHYVGDGRTGNYEMYGDLMMKGIKKAIKLDVEFGGIITDPWFNKKALFRVKGKINRKNWGLNWNKTVETGGVLVSEDVWVNCQIQLISEL